jgi:hypothetical protein
MNPESQNQEQGSGSGAREGDDLGQSSSQGDINKEVPFDSESFIEQKMVSPPSSEVLEVGH